MKEKFNNCDFEQEGYSEVLVSLKSGIFKFEKRLGCDGCTINKALSDPRHPGYKCNPNSAHNFPGICEFCRNPENLSGGISDEEILKDWRKGLDRRQQEKYQHKKGFRLISSWSGWIKVEKVKKDTLIITKKGKRWLKKKNSIIVYTKLGII